MRSPRVDLTIAMKDPENNVELSKVVVLCDDDVKLIQKYLLIMFDDIVGVLDELGIEWQLSGGSALGAIRHKGFIPWDDDIDINIKRLDVCKFASRFEEKYGDLYWVKVPGVTKAYDQTKIRIETKKIRARDLFEKDERNCGLWIDIFIIENTFDNALLRTLQGIGVMGFRYILSCVKFKRNEEALSEVAKPDSPLSKYIRSRCRLGAIFSVIPLSVWTCLSTKWVSLCKNENSRLVSIPGGRLQFFRELYCRDDFCNVERIEFEGRQAKVTCDYKTYFAILYGNNYTKIPPEADREKHIMLELDKKALEEAVRSK